MERREKKVTVGRPLWLCDALKQLADENNRSLPGYIRRVLWKHAEEREEP